ncbi:MAG TPA: cyclic nucleotide-binding domain-containing protein [Thermoanaerobaculia bacterium]
MKAVFKTTGGGSGKDPVRDSQLTFAAGERIFAQGDLGTEMFIIQDGVVEIFKHIGGQSHLLSRLEKGDFFGEMALLEALPRTAEALAVTEVRLVAINGSRFDEMLRKNPEVAVRIIRKYSKRLRDANELLEKLVGRKVDEEHVSLDSTQIAPVEKAVRHRLIDAVTGTAFYFSSGDETTLGRADPVTGILPDIDLTAVDTSRSVSRRHAKIIRSGTEYLILEEVGTVNGTYVNEQRIPTGVPVTLHDGDQLKIGLVAMKAVLE